MSNLSTARAVLAGAVLALLVVGVALLPALHPMATRLLAQRFSAGAEPGLSSARTLQLAEQVRGFVVDGSPDALPPRGEGRPGFGPSETSHLRDVRKVLWDARLLVGVLGAVAAVWLGVLIARRRLAEVSAALLWGCGFTLAGVAVAAAAATADFSATFALFHRAFFAEGTWAFPSGTLLIQIFPAGFWAAMGALWGGFAVCLGIALGVAGWLVRGVGIRE